MHICSHTRWTCQVKLSSILDPSNLETQVDASVDTGITPEMSDARLQI